MSRGALRSWTLFGLCAVHLLAAPAWSAQWVCDGNLTLSLDTKDLQAPEGPVTQVQASALLPAALVEKWTDDSATDPSASSSRGYRVHIRVTRDGRIVTPSRLRPGAGPLADWLGVYPAKLSGRMVWKRSALMGLSFLHPLGGPAAEYCITWFVNGRQARTEMLRLPLPPGAKVDQGISPPGGPLGAAPPVTAAPAGTGAPGEGAAVAAPPPADLEPSPPASAPIRAVMCRGLDARNRPLGAGTHFPADMEKLTLLVEHSLDPGRCAEIGVVMYRGDTVTSRHRVQVSGNGKFAIEYRCGRATGFIPGNWRLHIDVDGKPQSDLRFTIGE